MLVYQMSRKPAERAGLIESNALAEAITSEIKANRHSEQEKLVKILKNMAKSPKGIDSIFKAKTIPELVALLPNKNPRIVSYALTTLHVLIRHMGKPAKQQVRLCGGVERMVELIPRVQEKPMAQLQPILFDSIG